MVERGELEGGGGPVQPGEVIRPRAARPDHYRHPERELRDPRDLGSKRFYPEIPRSLSSLGMTWADISVLSIISSTAPARDRRPGRFCCGFAA